METPTDEVRLVVPARPEYLRLARVTAAGLATRLRFSFDEVEDLRLAIDELCYGLTGSDGRDGTVAIRYLLSGDELVVEGTGHFGDADGDPARSSPGLPASLSDLSEVILRALVDEHELASGPSGPTFRLLKRRQDAAVR